MPLRVLVIDPNAAASTLVQATLGREGYEVATAATLDEGLTRFHDAPADLVLLSSEAEPDQLEGWWTGGAAEALGRIPILVLGSGAEGVVSAAGTLLTPIEPDELLAQVRTQVGAPESSGTLAWLPDALREASDEIADMERLLGWPGGEPTGAAISEGQDPVSLGIFTEAEVHGADAGGDAPRDEAAPDASDAEAAAEPSGEESMGDEGAPDTGEAPPEGAREGAESEAPASVATDAVPKEADAPKGPASKGPASKGRPRPATLGGVPPERVAEIVADVAREAVERVVWETVPSMVARYISQSRAEQDRLFTQIVERVVWETVPEIAETQVRAEIRRITEGDEA